MPKQRARVPIAFGQGVARDQGVVVTRPGDMEDVRNFTIQKGRLRLRKGFHTPGALADAGLVGVPVGGRALPSEGLAIVCTWNEQTGAVQVFRVEANLSSISGVGTWFTYRGEDPPRVWLAESAGRMFMAHDEPNVMDRADTYVYDFTAMGGGGQLAPLTADLVRAEGDVSGAGELPVKFRGVVSHLDYLFGWGYGSPIEDRAEMVRASLPGEPMKFEPEHYWIAGDRRAPVLRCIPAGPNLAVFKADETFAIHGYDRRTFGIRRVDPLHGIAAPALADNVGGEIYFWSQEGPMATNGAGMAMSVEERLDLRGFDPTDLVERGDIGKGFCTYIPGEAVIAFFFGRRGYVLPVRIPGEEWSYWELGFEPTFAFRLTDTGTSLMGTPTGYPEWISASAGGTFADIEVGNHGQTGGETLEVWMRAGGTEEYVQVATVPVSPQAQQTVRITGLQEGGSYFGALRWRRSTGVADAYSGDPTGWPAISRGTIMMGTVDPPTVGRDSKRPYNNPSPGLNQWVWRRESAGLQYVQMRIFPGSTEPFHRIEVLRNAAGESPTVIATLLEGENQDFELSNLDTQGGFLFRDENPPQGAHLFYRARTVNAEQTETSPASSRAVMVWPGPLPLTGPAGSATAIPVPAQTSVFWIDQTRASVTVRLHRIAQPDDDAPPTLTMYDNWSAPAEDFDPPGTEPSAQFHTQNYPLSLNAHPDDQSNFPWGDANTSVTAERLFVAGVPSGRIWVIGARFSTTRFGVTDHSPMLTWTALTPGGGGSGGGGSSGGGMDNPEQPNGDS